LLALSFGEEQKKREIRGVEIFNEKLVIAKLVGFLLEIYKSTPEGSRQKDEDPFGCGSPLSLRTSLLLLAVPKEDQGRP